jgi:hypothetical protein
MAVDMFVNFGSIKGEATGDQHKDWIETCSPTLAGEKGLVEEACPGSDLKIGQGFDPTRVSSSKNGSAAHMQYHAAQNKDLPKPPLGDPIQASVLKATLNAQSLATEHNAKK